MFLIDLRGYVLSDCYDMVQSVAAFLCGHFGEYLDDFLYISNRGKRISADTKRAEKGTDGEQADQSLCFYKAEKIFKFQTYKLRCNFNEVTLAVELPLIGFVCDFQRQIHLAHHECTGGFRCGQFS